MRDRGHRDNIFNPRYRLVGGAVGPHKGYRDMCVMDFAGGEKDLSLVMKKDCELSCSGVLTEEMKEVLRNIRAKESFEQLCKGVEEKLSEGFQVCVVQWAIYAGAVASF